jgi:hypothetical protein
LYILYFLSLTFPKILIFAALNCVMENSIYPRDSFTAYVEVILFDLVDLCYIQ